MKICQIAAMSLNRVIGKGNALPWHIPEDFKFFKEKTLGAPVVMGRKTFDSLDGKPLPHRPNIVITRNKNYSVPKGVECVSCVGEALSVLQKKYAQQKEVFFIGGEEIYRQSLIFTDRIYLTVIEREFEGDAFFPEFSTDEFREIEKRQSEHEGLKFSFRVYDRRIAG